MSIEILVGIIVNKIFEQGNSFFKASHKSELQEVIQNSIKEFKQINPMKTEGKIPFYHSKTFMTALVSYRLFSDKQFEIDLDQFEDNIEVSEKKICQFIEIFERNLKANKKLKELYQKEKVPEKVFDTNNRVKLILPTLKMIDKKISDLDTFNKNNIYPKELTLLRNISECDVVGRENDLSAIEKMFRESNKPILIWGMGGVGKTTLAGRFVNNYYDEYDYIVWIDVENSIEFAVKSNYMLKENLQSMDTPPKALYDDIINKLNGIDQNKKGLFIIDNIPETMESFDKKFPTAPTWDILLTSRKKYDIFNLHDISFLNHKDAVTLFNKNYKRKKTLSELEVDNIVEKVEYHTLTIEILSKSASRNQWSYEEIQSALKMDEEVKVYVDHSAKKIERIKSYLASIFRISLLSEIDQWILKQFIVMPKIWIEREFIKSLIGIPDFENITNLNSYLTDLYEKGFLLENDEEYKFHPVLSEAIIDEIDLKIEDCNNLILNVNTKLSHDDAFEDFLDKYPYVIYGEEIISVFPESQTLNRVYLLSHLGKIYHSQGYYSIAEEYYLKSFSILKKKHSKRLIDLSTLNNNIGALYSEIGRYKEFLEYSLEAFRIDSKIYAESDPNLSVSASNLGEAYRFLQKYEEAEKYLKLALDKDLEFRGKKHHFTAIRYSLLGLLYRDLNQLEKSKEHLQLAYDIDIEIFGDEYSQIAVRLSNLAMAHFLLDQIDEAEACLKKALQKDVRNFWKLHPRIATRIYNLSQIYIKKGDISLAKACMRRVIIVDSHVFGVDSKQVINDRYVLDLLNSKSLGCEI